MECPNCQAIMHYDGEIWECLECGETFVEEEEFFDADMSWEENENDPSDLAWDKAENETLS